MLIYPNPSDGKLNINYTLSKDCNVNIGIYNILGEKIKEIENNSKAKGNYNLEYNLSSLPSGVYSCRMKSGDNSVIIKRLVISK